MAKFAAGSFTATDGTELTAHDAAWTSQGVTQLVINAGRVHQAGTGQALYWHSGTPASADYSVSADMHVLTTANSVIGVSGRSSTTAFTHYHVRWLSSSSAWQLYKFVAGSATLLGTFTETVADGVTIAFRLDMVGSTIKVFTGGIERISVSDTAITAANRAAIRGNTSSAITSTTTQHLDNFSADDIGALPPPQQRRPVCFICT